MKRNHWSLSVACLLASLLAVAASPTLAEVVIFDGFDDADRDNDGTSDDGNETSVPSTDGIGWYGINGLTSSFTKQKPFLTVADDAGGIDAGNALNIESVGANGEFMGAFDQSYVLGTAIGSRIAMSFDVRFTDLFLPASAEFRFGMYGDTDNQFGATGTNTDGSSVIWGSDDGDFDGSSPGAVGDLGIFARVPLGESPTLDGSGARIQDEDNANTILGGSGDSDLINVAGDDLFGVISDGTTNSFELAAERVAAGSTGETVMVTLTMTDSDGVVTTLSGVDGDSSSTDSFSTGDSFRYFVGTVTSDVDYRLDNFQLVVEEPTALAGDFNGDGMVNAADYTVWRDNDGAADESALNGAGDGMNGVDSGDYSLWVAQYGQASVTTVAIPEPTSALLSASLAIAALARRSRSSC